MTFRYLASPYTDPDEAVMEDRYKAVCHALAHLARTGGGTVYSPIAQWHPIACKYDLPRDHLWWQVQDREMILSSVGVIVLRLTGWDSSKGVTSEIKFAEAVNRPVEYL